MEAALLERNVLAERKAFYINELVEIFKEEHVDNENPATLVKMLDGYRAKLYETKEDEVYSSFLRRTQSKLQKLIDTKISRYDAINNVNIYIPLFDLSHSELLPYCYRDDVTLEEAAAIYVLATPKIFNCGFIEEYKHLLIDCAFVKEFYFLLGLLKRGVEQRKLQNSNALLTCRNFLLQYNIVLYDVEYCLKGEKIIDETFFIQAIIKAAQPKSNLSQDIGEYDDKKWNKDEGSNKTEKPLHAKEKESLLKLFIGMAALWYGHESVKNGDVTAGEISKELLEKFDMEIHEDTVRACW